MAAKDFRAGQVETSKLILSGGITNSTVGLAIYSGSKASNRSGGVSDSAMLSAAGTDVGIFVSGGFSFENRSSENTNVLFGGNLSTSGSMHFMNKTPLKAQATLSTTINGTLAHGLTAGQKITIISGDSTSKTYVMADPTLSDANTTATSHTPLVANGILGANATVTGVKAVIDNALTVGTTANGNEVVFNVPTTANGESGNVTIRILDTLISAQANVIQVKRSGGAVAPIHLIKAINGDSDANIVYGTGRGASGIAGITAEAGSNGDVSI